MSEDDRIRHLPNDDDIDMETAALLPPRADEAGKPICRKPGCPRTLHGKYLCQTHYRTALRLSRNGGRKAPGPAPDPTKYRSRHNPENPRRRKTSEEYRRGNLKYAYGITPEDYEKMVSDQGGLCAICKCDLASHSRIPHIDHDHATGAVRGVLCQHCNIGIGQFRDDPAVLQAAIDYLRSFSETATP